MYKKIILFIIMFCIIVNKVGYANTIYLTFDDGPLRGTQNILEVFEEEEVPATFFIVGLHVEMSQERKELINRLKESIYVLLANHSYSHAYGKYKEFYQNPERVKEDMKHNNSIIDIRGRAYARLPGRNVFRLPNISIDDAFIARIKDGESENKVYDLLFNSDFDLYGWDHEWESKSSGEPKQTVEQLVNEIDNIFATGSSVINGEIILLMHDQMFSDKFNGKENLRNLIHAIKLRNYRIANLREYNNIRYK